jgi:hypothetical protein
MHNLMKIENMKMGKDYKALGKVRRRERAREKREESGDEEKRMEEHEGAIERVLKKWEKAG